MRVDLALMVWVRVHLFDLRVLVVPLISSFVHGALTNVGVSRHDAGVVEFVRGIKWI